MINVLYNQYKTIPNIINHIYRKWIVNIIPKCWVYHWQKITVSIYIHLPHEFHVIISWNFAARRWNAWHFQPLGSSSGFSPLASALCAAAPAFSMGECYACGTWTATAGYGDRRGWSLFRGCQGGFYNRWVQSSGDIMGYTHNHIMRICMLCSVVYIYIGIYCLMLCYVVLCYVVLCYAMLIFMFMCMFMFMFMRMLYYVMVCFRYVLYHVCLNLISCYRHGDFREPTVRWDGFRPAGCFAGLTTMKWGFHGKKHAKN